MAGWDGASLSDVLAPQPAVVRQHRSRDAPSHPEQYGCEPRAPHSPRTAAALGLWQAPGPRNRAQAAHEELWGGDLGALLASTAANPRGPRARPAYAAREQMSTGVMAAMNNESVAESGRSAGQRVGDRQRRLRPASAQRLVDRHGHAEDGHGSGRAGGGAAAAGRSGGGGGSGGGEGSAGGRAAVRAGDGQAHLGDMQLSPVRTDALPSAQAWQGHPRLSAASLRASQLRGAHSQKCSL